MTQPDVRRHSTPPHRFARGDAPAPAAPDRWVAGPSGRRRPTPTAPGPASASLGPTRAMRSSSPACSTTGSSLAAGEHRADVFAGCLGVGLKRAVALRTGSCRLRPPVAFTLFGFLTDAPLGARRRPQALFAAAAHDYWVASGLVDAVPELTLRLTTPARSPNAPPTGAPSSSSDQSMSMTSPGRAAARRRLRSRSARH